MITVRKGNERGKTENNWLLSYHTFSFSNYYDPEFMGFYNLRVINEDTVAPTKGFGAHPHENMEILTYVIKGTLMHKDTMQNHSEIQKGEFQLMTAGTGIAHSEFNPSSTQEVHFLQIWINPKQDNLEPSYQQKSFQDHIQGLKLVVSPDGKMNSLRIHQDASIYLGKFQRTEELHFPANDRHIWIQLIHGTITVNDTPLSQGDGAAIDGEKSIRILAENGSQFLLFELM